MNLGYKYPPVHYYLTPAMKKTGLFIPSHLPALTYNDSNGNAIENHSKTISSSTPGFSQKSLPNGETNNAPGKHRALTNGYHSIPRTHRLNSNSERTPNGNRRTSKERQHETAASKYPPRAQ